MVRDHPLNSGLVAWWLALPHLSGGPRVYDVAGRYTASRLGASLTWSNTNRPGSLGSSPVLGSTGGYIQASQAGELSFANLAPFSYSVWLNSGTATNLNLISVGGNNSGGNNAIYTFGNNLQIDIGGTRTGTVTWANNIWIHFSATFDGTTVRTFGNGRLNATGTGASQTASSSVFQIGLSGRALAFDDFRIYNRALSIAEVAGVYNESQRGCPETIRRTRSSVSFSISATVSSLSATLGSLTLVGSGTSSPPIATGSLTAELGSITLTGSGTSSPPITVGNLSATLGSITLAGSGTSFKPNRWLFASESSGWSVTESTTRIGSVSEATAKTKMGVDPNQTREGGF